MKQFKRTLCVFLSVILIVSAFCDISALSATVDGKEISAAGAFVMDFETGIGLYEHNADTRRTPASTTKLAAVYVIYDAIKRGDVSLDTTATISQDVSTFSYDRVYSNVPTPAGRKVTIGKLLDFVMIHSACAATIALGEALYGSEKALVAKMNEKMKELGINAVFYDSYGGSADNRISPRGLAVLAANLIADHPEVLKVASKQTFTYDGTEYKNTNQLLQTYKGIDGLKTGYTGAAGYCFVGTAMQNGHRVISVTMGSTSLTTRFPDATALLDYGFKVVHDAVEAYKKEQESEPDVPEIPEETPPEEVPGDVTPDPKDPEYPDTGDDVLIPSVDGQTLPSSAVITVNGSAVPVTAYNIDGYHYFKLRDIAFLLAGTEKQFETSWDGDTNIVHLTSLTPYTAVGDELSIAPLDTYYYFSRGASEIYFDTIECSFIAYNIGDYNYFKLRDIATLIDFSVGWEDETHTVIIDTSLGYFDNLSGSDELYEHPDDGYDDDMVPGGQIPYITNPEDDLPAEDENGTETPPPDENTTDAPHGDDDSDQELPTEDDYGGLTAA